jgi:hypothetical protein
MCTILFNVQKLGISTIKYLDDFCLIFRINSYYPVKRCYNRQTKNGTRVF